MRSFFRILSELFYGNIVVKTFRRLVIIIMSLFGVRFVLKLDAIKEKIWFRLNVEGMMFLFNYAFQASLFLIYQLFITTY